MNKQKLLPTGRCHESVSPILPLAQSAYRDWVYDEWWTTSRRRPLAYCFSLIGNGNHIKSFQALFLTFGCISVLWGVFVILWMPDSPMHAKFFDEDDKRLMIERVRSNQTGLQNKQFRAYQILEAFRDPQVYYYMAIQVFTTLPTSGLANFANIIIESFEFCVLQTQLLSMVIGFYIIMVLFMTLFLIKKTGQNLYIMLGFIIPYVPDPGACSFPSVGFPYTPIQLHN